MHLCYIHTICSIFSFFWHRCLLEMCVFANFMLNKTVTSNPGTHSSPQDIISEADTFFSDSFNNFLHSESNSESENYFDPGENCFYYNYTETQREEQFKI